MQTSVIGFPRIGTLRELKFASEKYFKKEIEAGELLQKAQELRKTHWLTQKNAGITYISSNDFSFYDMVLDTAALLGIVPKRYKELNLSELDTYFAMARGYQGTFGDVKALAMKKWFNTNYHYIVPELEDDTEIKISGDKLWSEYAEAKSLGIETKPVVTGAYTILKLCRCTGNKTAADYVDEIVNAYKDLIEKCEKEQIAWIQFDEPALVQDMEKEDIELLAESFIQLFSKKLGKQVEGMAPEFLKALKAADWRGNIRELRNVIERSMIVCDKQLTLQDLPIEIQNARQEDYSGKNYSEFELAAMEKRHIAKVLQHTKGNKAEASRLLKIGLTTLYRKIEEYGI